MLRDQAIIINGLSKSHAMTGWRLGLIFAPAVFTAQLIKSHQYLVTAANTMAQHAAVEALTAGKNDAEPMKKEYIQRRDFTITEVLHKLVDESFLPVVDAEGVFQGIITRKSILKAVNALLHDFSKDYEIRCKWETGFQPF